MSLRSAVVVASHGSAGFLTIATRFFGQEAHIESQRGVCHVEVGSIASLLEVCRAAGLDTPPPES